MVSVSIGPTRYRPKVGQDLWVIRLVKLSGVRGLGLFNY